MTVYEIPNIEHCTVQEIGNPVMGYRINSNEGWYIHLNDGDVDTANIWKTAVGLRYDYPFEQVQIVAEADLPSDAHICAYVNKPVTE